jgi:transposase-like protein
LPLQKWFLAISLILNAKKGLSALQLSRDLEVNKNTAWRMGMQIRKAMSQMDQRELLTGIVEMDETYVGGKPRKGNKRGDDTPGGNKSKRGRGTDKAPVVGAVSRGGKVTAKAVKKDKMKGKHLRAFVKQCVNLDSAHLMTDEYKAYLGMSRLLPHSVICHAECYVDGDIHTNTIEGFWALLKRGMFGQFHSVSRKHLQMYVDEFCYRYNNRANDDVFGLTISRALGV